MPPARGPAAAACFLPAVPSSAQGSPQPAARSHRFVSSDEGTERSRVRQRACSSSAKGKSDPAGALTNHTQKPGLQAPPGLEKQRPRSSSYLQSNIHSCFTDAHSQCFCTGKGRRSHVQSECLVFCPTKHHASSRAVCTHLCPTPQLPSELGSTSPSHRALCPSRTQRLQQWDRGLWGSPAAGQLLQHCWSSTGQGSCSRDHTSAMRAGLSVTCLLYSLAQFLRDCLANISPITDTLCFTLSIPGSSCQHSLFSLLFLKSFI